LVKRAEHAPFAPVHLLDALLKVGTLQHSRIAEPAPHLIKQVPVLTESPQLARSATIEINGQRLTLDPDLTDAARDILKRLETGH